MQQRLHTTLRVLNVSALVVAIVWAFSKPGYDSILAAIIAASALLIHHHYLPTRRAGISLFFGHGRQHEQTEPAGADGKAFRCFSVGVKNTGNIPLDNCIVNLVAMKAVDGRKFENIYLPIGLMTQQQHVQKRRGGPFNLRCGQTKYVRVAALHELDDDSEIILPYETDQISNLVKRGEYEMRLEALGADTPAQLNLRVSVGNDGRLRVRKC